MALPQTFDPSSPADSDSPAQGAAKLRDIIQKFIDVFGIPQSPSTVSAKALIINTDGTWSAPIRLTNKTGGGVVLGNVAAIDSGNDTAVALGDTVSSLKRFVVSLETTANNSSGLWAYAGQISVSTQGTITRGHYIRKSATSLKVEDSGVAQGDAVAIPNTALGIALTADSGGFATCLWWGSSGGGGVSSTQTCYEQLTLESAVFPDASGTINNPPEYVRYISTGSQTSNSPKVTDDQGRFDAATDEHLEWGHLLPTNYASGGTVRLIWAAASATSGNAVLKASIVPTVDASSDARALVYNTVTTTTTAAPGTLGQTVTTTIALTTTNMAANRRINIFVGRDADNGSDTMTGDLYLVGVTLEYQVTLS
jgi:hypothetical protein